jgi:predicted peptidase
MIIILKLFSTKYQKHWITFSLFLISIIYSFLCSPRTVKAQEGVYVPGTLESKNLTMKYQVYLPPQYSPEEKWPLILFLHGAKERGNDGIAQTQIGLGPVLQEFPERFPAIVVFPQATKNMWWTESMGLLLAKDILDRVIQTYPVDSQRIYLTGVSMGGWGAWELGERYSHLFAAIAPIAAAKKPDDLTNNLNKMPIYAFHGDSDWICEVEATRAMVEKIQRLGNPNIRYTELPGAGHNQSWEIAYRNPDFADWLFQQSLK